ncbi:MAG TPA: alpha/beta hydrolase-fold protein [Verrucomicrobiae bacterium]|nr:alpha/beta hydrolase-fold protein [Verrucomicrobiae bacterium]
MILATSAASSFAEPLVSPEVHADGRVTFRLNAPGATGVVVRCEGKTWPMQIDTQGVWSVTSEALEPDIYAYSFLVDGLGIVDPANPFLKRNLIFTESQVHVPGPLTLPWEINDVPHGVIHRHHYRSKIIGDERDLLVYTPPGYQAAARKTYPVLYLLHGFSDPESAWIDAGRANVILDNLIARKKAVPMIVVMPLGYGNRQILAGGWEAFRVPNWQTYHDDSFAKFRESLYQEIMPMVERDYRVSTARTSRAIAGLSMGGEQSLVFGLNAPDRFAWVGAFSSGGLGKMDFEQRFPDLNRGAGRRFRLIWLACGTEDKLLASNRGFEQWLQTKGVTHQWLETPGAHSFVVWRRYLAEFVPHLFQRNQ